jgi:hypothetical protein
VAYKNIFDGGDRIPANRQTAGVGFFFSEDSDT